MLDQHAHANHKILFHCKLAIEAGSLAWKRMFRQAHLFTLMYQRPKGRCRICTSLCMLSASSSSSHKDWQGSWVGHKVHLVLSSQGQVAEQQQGVCCSRCMTHVCSCQDEVQQACIPHQLHSLSVLIKLSLAATAHLCAKHWLPQSPSLKALPRCKCELQAKLPCICCLMYSSSQTVHWQHDSSP